MRMCRAYGERDPVVRCVRQPQGASLVRRAFVPTQTSVVFSIDHMGACASGSPRFQAIGEPSGSTMRPSALTAATAPTTSSPCRSDAVPSPPFMPVPGSGSFPTVAPVPAPTEPSDTGPSPAASHAAYPASASGRAAGSPTTRSNSTAPTTMGMRAIPVSNPTPRSSSQRMTPFAAARPKALPPVSRIAFAPGMSVSGRRQSVPSVPGAPPRTSAAATEPSGHRITVHPVRPRGSVQCPTRTPGTSVITSSSPAPSSWTSSRRRGRSHAERRGP